MPVRLSICKLADMRRHTLSESKLPFDVTTGGARWADVMRRCEAAETDPSLRPALRASWPKVEPYRVADDDPRVKLRGQRGLRAAQAIKKHSVIGPYQARNCVICASSAHTHIAPSWEMGIGTVSSPISVSVLEWQCMPSAW